jgi:Tfp pilus assembly protein PilW
MEIKKTGFTLLETLVAISAIAVVGILIAQVFFTTTRSNTKTELLKDVKQNGDYAMEIMSRMIRNSEGITSSCLPNPGVTLSYVDIKNADGNTTEFGCLSDLTVLRIASTSASFPTPYYMTSSNATLGITSCADIPIEDFHFTCISSVDQPSTVTIHFKLSQKGTPVDQFEKASIVFQTAISPRN